MTDSLNYLSIVVSQVTPTHGGLHKQALFSLTVFVGEEFGSSWLVVTYRLQSERQLAL